jgi:rubredoxin
MMKPALKPDKCKTCGGTGWVTYDLGSDAVHSMMIQMGVDFEVACPDCEAGRAELEKTKREAR